MTTCCPIVELRQYTNYPGKRDALIALFDREFVETQEATGIQVIGQFRDTSDPDRFVWMRGFPDMAARATSLTAFYSGPIWAAHRDAARVTMYDSDNVLLLHPARDGAGFALGDTARPAPGSAPGRSDFIAVTLYYFAKPATDDFVRWFDDHLAPRFTGAGATVIAELVSDHSENTYPKLPLRKGENVFAWVARFADRAGYERYLAKLAGDALWSSELFAALHDQLARYPEVILLEPTPRSRLGHRGAPAAR